MTVSAQIVDRGAVVSPCGAYRYSLWRRWGEEAFGPLWIMLNPSTADASVDDPTIRRCVGFSRSWGYSSMVVANVFAYRATKPSDLAPAEERGIDIVGPENRERLANLIRYRTGPVVAAWGANSDGELPRELAVELGADLYCLGLTNSGRPRHPLYVRGDAELVPFWTDKS